MEPPQGTAGPGVTGGLWEMEPGGRCVSRSTAPGDPPCCPRGHLPPPPRWVLPCCPRDLLCLWPGGAAVCGCTGVQGCVQVCVQGGVPGCVPVCAGLCEPEQLRVPARTRVCTHPRGGVSRGRSRGRAGAAAAPGALGLPQPRRAARDRPGAGAGAEHAGAAPLLPRGSPRSGPSQSRGSDPARGSRRCRSPPGSVLRAARCRARGGRSGAGDTRQRLYCGRSPRGASGEGPGWAGGFPHHPRLSPTGRARGARGPPPPPCSARGRSAEPAGAGDAPGQVGGGARGCH